MRRPSIAIDCTLRLRGVHRVDRAVMQHQVDGLSRRSTAEVTIDRTNAHRCSGRIQRLFRMVGGIDRARTLARTNRRVERDMRAPPRRWSVTVATSNGRWPLNARAQANRRAAVPERRHIPAQSAHLQCRSLCATCNGLLSERRSGITGRHDDCESTVNAAGPVGRLARLARSVGVASEHAVPAQHAARRRSSGLSAAGLHGRQSVHGHVASLARQPRLQRDPVGIRPQPRSARHPDGTPHRDCWRPRARTRATRVTRLARASAAYTRARSQR